MKHKDRSTLSLGTSDNVIGNDNTMKLLDIQDEEEFIYTYVL